MSCRDDRLPPLASCTSYPTFGDTTVLFEFDASHSVDENNLTVALSYRWDYDGDLIWDTDYRKENSASHYFINPGTYCVSVEVSDFFGLADTASVTITVFGRNKDTGTMADPRDGQTYRTIKIEDSWWMAENLRHGTTIDHTIEQTDNGIVEMYRWRALSGSLDDRDTVGGAYRWQEAMNYNLNSTQGICPTGWHIPTYQEWKNLIDDYPQFYAVRFFGKDGLSGFNLNVSNNIMKNMTIEGYAFRYHCGGFWSSGFEREGGSILPGLTWFSQTDKYVEMGYQHETGPENDNQHVKYFTLRCKKD
jgi:uncharacterized protein (TIGR02145 family)